MQKIEVCNVKKVTYQTVNLNQVYDQEQKYEQKYEFDRSIVTPLEKGEGKLNVSFYTLQPGKSNYPYHQHLGHEEVFYVISGKAMLKTPKGEIEVSEGDVITMPPNENGAHMLTNHTEESMTYLDVHTITMPEVILYPDSGNVRVLNENLQKSFKLSSEVNYLDGE